LSGTESLTGGVRGVVDGELTAGAAGEPVAYAEAARTAPHGAVDFVREVCWSSPADSRKPLTLAKRKLLLGCGKIDSIMRCHAHFTMNWRRFDAHLCSMTATL
jgi:hypothetical protein